MSKKLKIAIIGSRGYPYVYSGYETLVKELSERLVKKGHTVRVYCHKYLFKNRPKKINGIELIYMPSLKSKILSQLYNSFFSFLHVCFSNTDVVFVVNSANGPFGILTKLFRKKTCINVDGLEWLRPKWKGVGSTYFKFSSKLATFFFDKIITDSNEMNLIYKEKFNTNSTTIAYGPTMIVDAKSDILKKNSLKKNNYYLVVGRLIPDNNSDIIIKGFINSGSKKKLVIVGDVPYIDKFSRSVKTLASEKVIFLGYIKNMNDLSFLYNNCYAYIHGHEYGGTNPSLINALFFNCEILALETKFNIEMLIKKESTFFNKNINSITNSIYHFEKNNTGLKKDNSKYVMPEKYDWDKITESYLKLFKKII